MPPAIKALDTVACSEQKCLLLLTNFRLFTCNILAGNEVHIVVKTDTEYEKKDSNNHFGLKCQVIGYEWSNNPSDVSISQC